ncbi:hypothetical protein TorRG33x02_355450, partial [Trema orientale]
MTTTSRQEVESLEQVNILSPSHVNEEVDKTPEKAHSQSHSNWEIDKSLEKTLSLSTKLASKELLEECKIISPKNIAEETRPVPPNASPVKEIHPLCMPRGLL